MTEEHGMALEEQFLHPPKGYGIVPFYWWMGDPLTRERLAWQLDQLEGHSISGLQINYAHDCEGGQSYGLTYPSDPPLFSEEWWELVGWFADEGKKRGFAVSLSDYTISSPGQGGYVDRILAEHPELRGRLLELDSAPVSPDEDYLAPVPEGFLSAVFYDGTFTELLEPRNGAILFRPDRVGTVFTVSAVEQEYSYDPMHPDSGSLVCSHFYGLFEERFPGRLGTDINFFFSDELDFGLRGKLWNPFFAAEFQKRKGYDIIPHLAALFVELGDRTTKIRLDYSDVMVALQEEHYFGPVYHWHEERGMLIGCDHGGRGRDVGEFGDYFRTQKYNQGPGCDQPGLTSDIVKNKVASSISHLYKRPRVWLEGFYGSGWGTSAAQLTDAIYRNYAMGQNLLSLHGLYYSTHGGWWEWAPPCNCFRMPYWEDAAGLLQTVERLSFLLSRGVHVCDTAIVYPVASAEAGIGAEEASDTAFRAAELLYRSGNDLDFIDFESIVNAKISGDRLHISGESYSVVILPAMQAVRFAMLEKLNAFRRAGGTVLAIGSTPRFSDRAGGNDPVLDTLVADLFPTGSVIILEELLPTIRRAVPIPDFTCEYRGDIYLNHRRIGERDAYFVYGIPAGTLCHFRTSGTPVLWDAATGERQLLAVETTDGNGTALRLPLEATEAQLIIFEPSPNSLQPLRTFTPTARIDLDDEWDFTLLPTLDNRFGDYRIPASGMIGPELRLCDYAVSADGELPPEEAFLEKARFSYGPYFLKAGPFPSETAFLAAVQDAAKGELEQFAEYPFSMRYGVWNDPGKQGYHGLKEKVSDLFLTVGEKQSTLTGTEYIPGSEGGGAVFYTTVFCKNPCEAKLLLEGIAPATIHLDGEAVADLEKSFHLDAGYHSVVVGYYECGRAAVAVVDVSKTQPDWQAPPLSMKWSDMPGLLPFDCHSGERPRYGFYRFLSPPGLLSMRIPCSDPVRAFIDGIELPLKEENSSWIAELPEPFSSPRTILLRVAFSHGRYGGAALGEAIEFTCTTGRMTAGDWSVVDGLASYSGGAVYAQTVQLSEEFITKSTLLELEDVAASARVHINGVEAGIRTAPPWRFSVGQLLRPGDNRIEVTVHNTLANHYQSIPTRYRGESRSGLLGKAALIIGKE